MYFVLFFFQAEDGIRDGTVTGVQTCALPIYVLPRREDVEVQEEHRGPGTFDRGVRRGHGAPLLPLCGAAGEGPGVEIGKRRVGKECRSGWSPEHEKKKREERCGFQGIGEEER